MQKFPVNEIFESLQGEGFFAGRPVLFIRFQGCDIGCKFCDTKHAFKVAPENRTDDITEILNKRYSNERYTMIDQDHLINIVLNDYKRDMVVLTGGEPFLYPIENLVYKLILAGLQVNIETSGTKKIDVVNSAWITLSPKNGTLSENFRKADELKLIIGKPDDIKNYSTVFHLFENDRIFLQPESMSKSMTEFCIDKCMEHNFSLSVQIHKYIDVK